MAKSSSTYKNNLTLFLERFPQLGLLAPSWPIREVEEEALAPLNLEKAEALYFYGLGTGSLYPQVLTWLKEKKERELIFLEDDPSVIASFLYRKNGSAILSDPQVQIALLSKGRARQKELEVLAERLPVRRIEIGALPSYKNKIFQNLRLTLLRKTTLSHALHLDRLHGYQPFQNFLKNLRQLPRSFYMNGLKGAFQGIPAIVCGAGPSLQRSMETLRTLENKALIIAGGSTIAALSSQGVLPHFGMAVDPNLEEYRRLKNSFAFEVPLLYSTRVFPAIFQTGNGPFGYMRSGIGGVPELWIEEELGLLDPLIGDFLSPESISVTAICLAAAQFFGCNPILLNGVDLAYTGKRRYASGVAEEEELFFDEIDAEKSAPDRIVKRKDRLGAPIYTAVRWVMEAASLSHFAKKHSEVTFLNTTEGGLPIRGIEFISLEEAAKKHLKSEMDLRELVHQKIAASPMPERISEIIAAKVAELKESCERAIDHLEILAGKKKGSSALAEMELKEEAAYAYLFYDIQGVLSKDPSCKNKWEKFLEVAQKYRLVFP